MLLRAALDLARLALSPPRCAACDARTQPFAVMCPLCEVGFEVDLDPVGLAVGGQAVRAIAAARYGGPVAQAIHRLKFGARSDLARPLSAWLADAAPALSTPVDLVAPVPLAPGRVRERGYDQAALLALSLASRLGVPARPGAVRRVRATAQQSLLDRDARQANVAGAFAPGPERRHVAGRRVVLVDDVFTTGATAAAASAALFEAGAASVSVLALARSERDAPASALHDPGLAAPPLGIRQRAMIGT